MVETPASDNLNLLTETHYFSPDTIPEVTFAFCKKKKTDTQNFSVIMVGEFNTPGLNWILGLSLPNLHYYSKLRDAR
jgi:hypothetical protein